MQRESNGPGPCTSIYLQGKEYSHEAEPQSSWFASQGLNLPAITGLVIPQEGRAIGLHPPFGARSQEKDGVATIALSGELDMATAPILSDSLAPLRGQRRLDDRPGTP